MVKCICCGQIFDETADDSIDKRTPCPSCGSNARDFDERNRLVDIEAHLSIKGKITNESKSKKSLVEIESGDDFTKKTRT